MSAAIGGALSEQRRQLDQAQAANLERACMCAGWMICANRCCRWGQADPCSPRPDRRCHGAVVALWRDIPASVQPWMSRGAAGDDLASLLNATEKELDEIVSACVKPFVPQGGASDSCGGAGNITATLEDMAGQVGDVAKQTNLLALNAAIEAAPRRRGRAGFCGGGRRGAQVVHASGEMGRRIGDTVVRHQCDQGNPCRVIAMPATIRPWCRRRASGSARWWHLQQRRGGAGGRFTLDHRRGPRPRRGDCGGAGFLQFRIGSVRF